MKAIIYSRVSTQAQSNERQITDLKKIDGFVVEKVFKEKISGFTKSATERPILQKALQYIREKEIDCLMVHEISRLSRNTTDVLSLIDALKSEKIKLYIHNLGVTLNSGKTQEDLYSKLIVTIIADLSRLESEQMSYRIKSGIQHRKSLGLTTGRKPNSTESPEKFISKHQDILKLIGKGYSSREIQKICKCSSNTVQKVKKWNENNRI